MRVGELSRRSGVSVPSIKYYLREGLLPPGERTGPNQAAYGEDHLRRLRLIRALIDVGGLSVAGTRDVLAAVDGDENLHEVLGTAQAAVVGVPEPADDAPHAHAKKIVADMVERRGWDVAEKNPGRRAAIDVLAAWENFGDVDGALVVDRYAEAMEAVARQEVETLEEGAREASVETAVLAIVLGGALLTALRGMAQEDASARRLR